MEIRCGEAITGNVRPPQGGRCSKRSLAQQPPGGSRGTAVTGGALVSDNGSHWDTLRI